MTHTHGPPELHGGDLGHVEGGYHCGHTYKEEEGWEWVEFRGKWDISHTYIPAAIPMTNLPKMNMMGWMASDCKATPTTTTTLLNSSVYFLWRGEFVLSTLRYCDTQPKNHCIQLLNSLFLKFRLDRLVGWLSKMYKS